MTVDAVWTAEEKGWQIRVTARGRSYTPAVLGYGPEQLALVGEIVRAMYPPPYQVNVRPPEGLVKREP